MGWVVIAPPAPPPAPPATIPAPPKEGEEAKKAERRTVSETWIVFTFTPPAAPAPIDVSEACDQCGVHKHVPADDSKVTDPGTGQDRTVTQEYDLAAAGGPPLKVNERTKKWHVNAGEKGSHFGKWYGGGAETITATRHSWDEERQALRKTWNIVAGSDKWEQDTKTRKLGPTVVWEKEEKRVCDLNKLFSMLPGFDEPFGHLAVLVSNAVLAMNSSVQRISIEDRRSWQGAVEALESIQGTTIGFDASDVSAPQMLVLAVGSGGQAVKQLGRLQFKISEGVLIFGEWLPAAVGPDGPAGRPNG